MRPHLGLWRWGCRWECSGRVRCSQGCMRCRDGSRHWQSRYRSPLQLSLLQGFGAGIKGAALWFANAVACWDASVLGVLVHIESVSPATAKSMRGTTRRFGSGARTPQAAVRLERWREPRLAFHGASRARIGSKCRLPGLQGTYRQPGCELGLAKSLFQKDARPSVVS